MNVKRVSTVLMVGLVLLSAMVVFTGIAAAATMNGIKFSGTIPDADAVVEIKRTEPSGYTETWRGATDSSGHFVTDVKQYGTDASQPQPTRTNVTGYYQMYINSVPDEGKVIGLKGGPACSYSGNPPCVPGEIYDANGFTFVWGSNCMDCYYIYDWQKTPIPEFSTIAIPIASILGLLFFFNRRKHRKE